MIARCPFQKLPPNDQNKYENTKRKPAEKDSRGLVRDRLRVAIRGEKAKSFCSRLGLQ